MPVRLVLIGDSIITNSDKCNDIFDKFLFIRFLNFGISGDKIQYVLWRVCDMTLQASVENAIIHHGTNNLCQNSPLKITAGLINTNCMLKKNYKNLHISRDDEKSVNKSLLYAVNSYLKDFYTNSFHYIELDSVGALNNHLNTELFRNDNLHLNRKGYEKLSKLIMGKIIFTSNGKIVL